MRKVFNFSIFERRHSFVLYYLYESNRKNVIQIFQKFGFEISNFKI